MDTSKVKKMALLAAVLGITMAMKPTVCSASVDAFGNDDTADQWGGYTRNGNGDSGYQQVGGSGIYMYYDNNGNFATGCSQGDNSCDWTDTVTPIDPCAGQDPSQCG